MRRSEITVDLGALRRNIRRLREAAAPAELWAVVKADAYGHGSFEVARVALEEGAGALCVATVQEGAALREPFPEPRILVMGPLASGDEGLARTASLEIALSSFDQAPQGLPLHLKVDTGMGRYGMAPAEVAVPAGAIVVGVMSHLATADEPDETFARRQLDAFSALRQRFPRELLFHLANSAATLRFPEASFGAVRCGVALYGLSPFGDDPGRHELEPVLSWRSYLAQIKELEPGESTGYGRRFLAERPTRVGLVPVGYGDGFRRGLTGTEVVVAGNRRRVVGTISMDSFAVELGDEQEGDAVTILGDGVLAEEHARVLGTINYEVTCAIRREPERASVKYVDG